MRILVTGGAGMVGEAIQKVFKNDELILTDINTLNVTSWDSVKKYKDCKADWIFHLAAIIDLEECERNPFWAYGINHTGTVHMAMLAKEMKIPIVYISTAGIFDGSKDFVEEHVTPNPLNIYGRSKYYGEHIMNHYLLGYTFRAGWMFGGGGDLDKKFIGKIYRKARIGEGIINALDDTFATPTYTVDLANIIKQALEKKIPYGTYHASCCDKVSRYELAATFFKYLQDINHIKVGNVEVRNVNGDFFKNEFFCLRSKNETLNTNKLKEYGIQTRSWKEALKDYVDEYFK